MSLPSLPQGLSVPARLTALTAGAVLLLAAPASAAVPGARPAGPRPPAPTAPAGPPSPHPVHRPATAAYVALPPRERRDGTAQVSATSLLDPSVRSLSLPVWT